MVRRLRGSWLALSLALPACGIEPDNGFHVTDLREFTTLIDQDMWEVVPEAEDPLAEHRPAAFDCGPSAWFLEADMVEVDTTLCNYLALRQPTLAAIELGMPMHVGLYHFDLVAPEQAQAHVAILIEGEVVWEEFVEIPATARIYDIEFDAPLSAPAGAEMILHLHNHGQNQWALQDFSAKLD